MEIAWHSESRVASIRYAPDTNLTGKEARVLIDALGGWIGDAPEPFAILADATGVRGADAEYRAMTTAFYRQHRERIYIALMNIGPLIRVLAELFRVGSGLPVKAFAGEAEARLWLRSNGIVA